MTVKDQNFKIVDVGGQRSQRQKWFQCFDNVDSILYLVASSAFDQNLLEDRVTNRLVESVNIFETIVNNRCFKNVSIILFLNKTDLLEVRLIICCYCCLRSLCLRRRLRLRLLRIIFRTSKMTLATLTPFRYSSSLSLTQFATREGRISSTTELLPHRQSR